MHRTNRIQLAWAIVAAFGTYFCMYAFRKPFAVAQYEGYFVGEWKYKTVAISAQVLGYVIAKFISIKVLSEMGTRHRVAAIIGMIVTAEVALVIFATVSPPYNLVCLFLNGLPLGMVFGVVLSYLEGRRHTEALTAGLCTSFILADGFTKSVGKAVLDWGVSPFWMPAATGGLFLLPLLGFVWMLSRVKQPSLEDVLARSERVPMNRSQRWAFFRSHSGVLGSLLVLFFLVTIVRSVRSDFAPEIWESMGVTTTPALFSYSELWVGLAVTLVNGAAVCVAENSRAFRLGLGICVAGLLTLLAVTIGQHGGLVPPFLFMVLAGVGLYLPYVAVHTTLFERLIAMTRDRGNLVFLMCLADFVGYLGYVGVMSTRNIWTLQGDFMSFFRPICYGAGAVSLLCVAYCWYAFRFGADPREALAEVYAEDPRMTAAWAADARAAPVLQADRR